MKFGVKVFLAVLIGGIFFISCTARPTIETTASASGEKTATAPEPVTPDIDNITLFIFMKPGVNQAATKMWKQMLVDQASSYSAGMVSYTLDGDKFSSSSDSPAFSSSLSRESLISSTDAGNLIMVTANIKGAVLPYDVQINTVEIKISDLREAEQPAVMAMRRVAEKLNRASGKLWVRRAELLSTLSIAYEIGSAE